MSHYKNLNDELNWDNVNFPSSDVDIDTFEENNGGKIAVNVYFLDPEEGKQSILLSRQSKVSKATHQVSLLKLEDGDDYHYVFINDYDKIIGSQTNKMKAKKHHCFHITMERSTIEIVNCPIKHAGSFQFVLWLYVALFPIILMVIFHSKLLVYQRVTTLVLPIAVMPPGPSLCALGLAWSRTDFRRHRCTVPKQCPGWKKTLGAMGFSWEMVIFMRCSWDLVVIYIGFTAISWWFHGGLVGLLAG